MNAVHTPVITEDLLLLYELSLAVGQSLDAPATCRDFIRILMARRNLDGAYVWWLAPSPDGGKARRLELLDGMPKRAVVTADPAAADNIWRLVTGGAPVIVEAGAPSAAAIGVTAGGSCLLLPLADEGVLQLNSASPGAFTPRTVGQLRTVVSKLANAIRGGLAHARLKDSEAALRVAEQKLLTILDNVDAHIYLKDPSGRYLFVNRRTRELLGIPAGAAFGHDDVGFFDTATKDTIRRNDRRVLQDGEVLRIEETTRIATTGQVSVFQSTKLPLRDDNGAIYALCGISMDVTARKASERALADSHNLLRTIIDNAPIRVFWKDANLRYLGGNPAFARDAGLADADELVGKDDFQLAWKDQAGLYRADDRRILESGIPKLSYDEPQTTPDGATIWLRTSKVPLRDSRQQVIGVLGVYEDITPRKMAEEAQRRAEEQSIRLASMLRLLCDNVPDMIWAKDLDKRYLFANKAICEQLLSARDTDEPVGKTDLFFAQRERASHPSDDQWHTFGELCQDSDTVTLNQGRPCVFEEFGNVKGRHVVLAVHKAPFRNERGEVIGTVGSARDVTESQKIREELDRHRQHLEELVGQRTAELLATEQRASHILHSSADGLYGTDCDGRISFINPAACAMFGYTPEQAIGRNAHELFHHSSADGTHYPAEDCPGFNALVDGESRRVDDGIYWHADGHPVPVMYAMHPMSSNGRFAGSVVSVVDMTSQRAAQQAREAALVAAEKLARARREFMANMSHEIRTPLNGVLGFAQIGLRNCDDGEKSRQAFQKIISSGNLLLGVIGDILDFSKIEAGKLVVEPAVMDTRRTVLDTLDMVRERAAGKGLQLTSHFAPGLPESILCDGLRLQQVLLNVLSNAVKFTEAGGVTVSTALRLGQLEFRITDTGIGMNAEQLSRLFNPFMQADSSTTRRFGGTGLGLAISKRVVELLGGDIEVQSRYGAGSTFIVRIPFVPPSSAQLQPGSDPPSAASARPASLAGLSILVAEDDPASQKLLDEALKDEGATVVCVETGRAAVDFIRQAGAHRFDVVLMDIQMPEMDGYEATRQIGGIAPGLPVIGQTAHAMAGEQQKCLAAGMVDYLSKPVDLDRLMELVARHGRARRPR